MGTRCGVAAAAIALACPPVLVVSSSPASAATLLGQWGSKGSGNGQFDRPMDVAVAPRGGDVYVTDYGNNRVEEFSATGRFIRSFNAGTYLPNPWGVAVGPNGDVYVTSNRNANVQEFSATGVFIRKWGSGDGTFVDPRGIAVGPNGNVFVADTGHGLIKEYTATGTFVRAWAPKDIGGSSAPNWLAVGPGGDIYATTFAWVEKFSPGGTYLGAWGVNGTSTGQFPSAKGVAAGPDPYRDVFVIDVDASRGRVLEFEGSGRPVQTWAGPPSNASLFNNPHGIAVSPDYQVYIANTYSNSILRFSPH